MGIKTMMITGDNPPDRRRPSPRRRGWTTSLPKRKPEDKLQLNLDHPEGRPSCGHDRRRHQRRPGAGPGRRGPGHELRHARPPRRPGNMVDLDSDPTKILEVVEIGKQLLITRGRAHHVQPSPTTWPSTSPSSLRMFMAALPELGVLNVMHLSTPHERHPVRSDLQRHDHHPA